MLKCQRIPFLQKPASIITNETIRVLNKLPPHKIISETVAFRNIIDKNDLHKSTFLSKNIILDGDKDWTYKNYNRYRFPNVENVMFTQETVWGVTSRIYIGSSDKLGWRPTVYLDENQCFKVTNKRESNDRFIVLSRFEISSTFDLLEYDTSLHDSIEVFLHNHEKYISDMESRGLNLDDHVQFENFHGRI